VDDRIDRDAGDVKVEKHTLCAKVVTVQVVTQVERADSKVLVCSLGRDIGIGLSRQSNKRSQDAGLTSLFRQDD
jgi:hypothetical protein